MTSSIKNQYILFTEKSCVRLTQDEYKAHCEKESLEERTAVYFQSFAISAGKLVSKKPIIPWPNQIYGEAPPVIAALPRKRKHADIDPQLLDVNSSATPIGPLFDPIDLFDPASHGGDEI
jgi:hypothetical protein